MRPRILGIVLAVIVVGGVAATITMLATAPK
jgi:hypothetical protein